MARPSRRSQKRKKKKNAQGAGPASEAPRSAAECALLAQECCDRLDYAEASKHYARAAKLEPGDAMRHADHAYALGLAADFDAAQTAYDKAASLAPGDANVLARFAEMLINCGLQERARDLSRKALLYDANCAKAHICLSWALRRLGEVNEAIKHGEQAVALSRDPDAAFYLGFAYLAADRHADALRLCERELARDPRNVRALALKVSTLDGVGQRDAGCTLADFDALIWSAELRAPPGYASMEEFNQELADTVMRSPGRPLDDSQTLDLFLQPEGALMTLWRVFNEASQAYFQRLPMQPNHPFLCYRPTSWTLESWGTRFQTQGDEQPHIHQHAWLSGVYYVDVPDFVQNGPEDSFDGCIEFSRFLSYSGSPVDTDTMVIRPKPGALALFPAYMYHRVMPYNTNRRRISIAFNLMPTG